MAEDRDGDCVAGFSITRRRLEIDAKINQPADLFASAALFLLLPRSVNASVAKSGRWGDTFHRGNVLPVLPCVFIHTLSRAGIFFQMLDTVG